MTRVLFLNRLRQGLAGLSPGEIDDVVADYEAHFADGAAAGRSEADVETALGDPIRLAKELRAEAGLRKFETSGSPRNFLRAGMGLLPLIGFDFIIVLPLLLLLLFPIGVIIYVLHVIGGVAFGLIAALAHGAAATGLVGLALLSAVIGVGALIALLLVGVLKFLGGYVRRRYRLLDRDDSVEGEAA